MATVPISRKMAVNQSVRVSSGWLCLCVQRHFADAVVGAGTKLIGYEQRWKDHGDRLCENCHENKENGDSVS